MADIANELDELVKAKGLDELDELAVAKGCNKLDELIVAGGPDEELVEARSWAMSQVEFDELVMAKGLHVKNVDKVSDFTAHLCCYRQGFSLTKYCAVFSKDKRYFGMTAPSNQIGMGDLKMVPFGTLYPGCTLKTTY